MSTTTLPPLPDVLNDNERRYKKGRFLGKGGFARCYEVTETKSGTKHACKAVAKINLVKQSSKDKMALEVDIQRTARHTYIVQLIKTFENPDYVFLILELCSNKSLLEMQKRRGHVTEPEARFLLHQTVAGVSYLHENLIIHRDLKLGNIFLNDDMNVKIGDFGLATRLNHPNERKDTLCGTPNYIAPEMLRRQRHSFEVDIWAIGCILYTLIVGHPPFETKSLQDTYQRIKKNLYDFPDAIGFDASELIRNLLHPDYRHRPMAQKVREFAFFKNGVMLDSLPVTSLTVAPKINSKMLSGGSVCAKSFSKQLQTADDASTPIILQSSCSNPKQDVDSIILQQKENKNAAANNMQHLRMLENQLHRTLSDIEKNKNKKAPIDVLGRSPDVEAETPRSASVYHIARWVDYSDKYGLGYQLTDESNGVVFNDGSRVTSDGAISNMMVCDKNGKEEYFTRAAHPPMYRKKVSLLMFFADYMRKQLVSSGNIVSHKLARPPYLVTWFRSKAAITFHMSDGTVQVNFFENHYKFILCPNMQAVTVIVEKEIHTYSFESLASGACSTEMFTHLKIIKSSIERLMQRGATKAT